MILAVDPVPTDYAQRKKLWVNSSIWLLINERPYVPLAVQGLGYAERMLLDMEQRLAAMTASNEPRNARDRLLSDVRHIRYCGFLACTKSCALYGKPKPTTSNRCVTYSGGSRFSGCRSPSMR